SPSLTVVDVVADFPRVGQTLVVVGPGGGTPAQTSSPEPKGSAGGSDYPGGAMASVSESPTAGAGAGLDQRPGRPGKTAAERQDSGYQEVVSVPRPPGVVSVPTQAPPPTLAESRAAVQPVQVGPDDLVLLKTKRVDNPTGAVLWLREDSRDGPGSVERLAAM